MSASATKPLFQLSNVTLDDIRYMGDAEQHMRFFAWSHSGRRIQCVLFNDAQRYGLAVHARRPVELVGTLECQVWQGQERIQFLVDEIKFNSFGLTATPENGIILYSMKAIKPHNGRI